MVIMYAYGLNTHKMIDLRLAIRMALDVIYQYTGVQEGQ